MWLVTPSQSWPALSIPFHFIMPSSSWKVLEYNYDHVQWELLPPWVEHGIVRFPFMTTAEAQTFSDMMAAHMGTMMLLAHTVDLVKDVSWVMEIFMAEVVCLHQWFNLVMFLMDPSWQGLDFREMLHSKPLNLLPQLLLESIWDIGHYSVRGSPFQSHPQHWS